MPDLKHWRGLAVAAACVLLTGCASTFDYQWTRVSPPMAGRVYVYTPAAEDECKALTGVARPLACATRYPAYDTCLVLLPPSPPRWLVEHEERHCAGDDHL